MDYKKIRLELFVCMDNLSFYLHCVYLDANNIYEQLVTNGLDEIFSNYVVGFIYWFNKLKEFASKYDIEV